MALTTWLASFAASLLLCTICVHAAAPSLMQLGAQVRTGAHAPSVVRSALLDEESIFDGPLPAKTPYFSSPYLECDDDSDCCPKSRCSFPSKGVRGTSDHKTCIMVGSGGVTPEVYCSPCSPVSARYRNGVCDPSTAKFYDKPAKLDGKKKKKGEHSEGSTVEGSIFGPDDDDERPRRNHHKKRPRLPEADVPGEAPHTILDSDEVDNVARDTILAARQTKCDQTDEWCQEMLTEQAPDVDPETQMDRAVKRKMIREEMMELRRHLKRLKKQGLLPQYPSDSDVL